MNIFIDRLYTIETLEHEKTYQWNKKHLKTIEIDEKNNRFGEQG